jgi:hypothetical protein
MASSKYLFCSLCIPETVKRHNVSYEGVHTKVDLTVAVGYYVGLKVGLRKSNDLPRVK